MAKADRSPSVEEVTSRLEAMGISEEAPQQEVVAVEVAKEEGQEPEVAQEEGSDPIAVLAKQHGWDPTKAKSAQEYVAYALENLEPRGKEIKELKTTMEELKGFMTKQQELGYKKALSELENARRDAIRQGEVEQVEALDFQIQEQRNELGTGFAKDAQVVVSAFAEKHKDWIHDPSYECQEIREFVKRRDQELVAFGLSPSKHIATIEHDLEKQFPNRFAPKVQEKPSMPMVESDGRPVSGAKKHQVGFSDLNDNQKQCARHFERRGIMTRDEYIKSLIDLGEIK